MSAEDYNTFLSQHKLLQPFFLKSPCEDPRTGKEVIKFKGKPWRLVDPAERDILEWFAELHSKEIEFVKLPMDFVYLVTQDRGTSDFLLLPIDPAFDKKLNPFELVPSGRLTSPQRFREVCADLLWQCLLRSLSLGKVLSAERKVLTLAPVVDFIPISRLLHKDLEHCKVIGKGGFGDIYLTALTPEGSDTEIEVALKVLKVERRTKAAVLEQFVEEYLLMREVRHQNILRAFGYTKLGGVVLLVLEYCKKGSLRDYVLNNSLSDHEKFRILLGVAQGLCCLHARGILHLDVKPHNILLNAQTVPKVADFGLSRRLQREEVAEKTGFTLLFTSPEQLQGAPVTTKSDVWAFGSLMYFVFTKKVPYEQLGVDVKNVTSFATKNSLTSALFERCRRAPFDGTEGERLQRDFPRVVSLIYQCWNIEADARPTMIKVEAVLRNLLLSLEA